MTVFQTFAAQYVGREQTLVNSFFTSVSPKSLAFRFYEPAVAIRNIFILVLILLYDRLFSEHRPKLLIEIGKRGFESRDRNLFGRSLAAVFFGVLVFERQLIK